MRLILHIGTEKTGTTSIQEVLFKNRVLLKQNGFHFLQSAGKKNNRALPACCMSFERSDPYLKSKNVISFEDRQVFKKNVKRDLAHELDNLEENIHTVIISSEHFHSRLKTQEEVAELSELLSPYFNNIHILCYLRQQGDMCVSLYSTAIKMGYSGALLDLVEKSCKVSNPYYNYEKLLGMWEREFGLSSIDASLFSRAHFLNGDLIDDFFAKIDVNLLGVIDKDAASENASLTSLGQCIGRAVNTVYPRFDDRNQNNPIQRNLIKIVEKHHSGRGELISEELWKDIFCRFETSNEVVRSKYFPDLVELFPANSYHKNDNKVEDPESLEQTLVEIFDALSFANEGKIK